MEITNISKPKKIKKYPIISIELSKEKTIRKTIKENRYLIGFFAFN